MARHRDVPRLIRIEVTNKCTARCTFCPHSVMTREQGIMDMALFRTIIDDVVECGIGRVSLHGLGEPLMDPFLFDRIRYCGERSVPLISTNTNAAFLSLKMCDRLLESPLHEIFVSLDAATPGAYGKIRPGLDFERVEANVRYLCEENARRGRGLSIYLSFVETGDNIGDVPRYRKKWNRLVTGISFSLMHNWAGAVECSGPRAAPPRPVRRDPCRPIWTDMNVLWDGRVPLCCYDHDGVVVIGDLHRESIRQVWGGDSLEAVRRAHRACEFETIPICAPCSVNSHTKSPWWISE